MDMYGRFIALMSFWGIHHLAFILKYLSSGFQSGFEATWIMQMK